MLSTVSTGGVVTVEDIIESIEWLSRDRPQRGHRLISSLE